MSLFVATKNVVGIWENLNQEEAENFCEHLTDLMLKYNLDECTDPLESISAFANEASQILNESDAQAFVEELEQMRQETF